VTALNDRLFNLGARVEQMIWIPGATCAERPPEVFCAFLEDLFDGSGSTPQLADPLPMLTEFIGDGNDADAEAQEKVTNALAGTDGFLVRLASPVRSYEPGSEAFMSGWGHYYTTWIYAPTIDALPDQIEAWVEEMAARDKATARKRQSRQA
jgi:hypothetical protein